jgi:aspartate aminotransferase-like enzyme
VSVEAFRSLLSSRYGVIIAGGRGTAKISERMVRVGHLGAVSTGDIVQVLWAIEQVLEELDHAPADGRTLAAAQPLLTSATEAVGTR